MMSAVSEDQLQGTVIQMAQYLGWRVVHFRPARTETGWRTAVQGDGKGFPDTILLRGQRLIIAELKREGGRLRPEQVDWLAAWRQLPMAEVFVWQPSDLEEIKRLLA